MKRFEIVYIFPVIDVFSYYEVSKHQLIRATSFSHAEQLFKEQMPFKIKQINLLENEDAK